MAGGSAASDCAIRPDGRNISAAADVIGRASQRDPGYSGTASAEGCPHNTQTIEGRGDRLAGDAAACEDIYAQRAAVWMTASLGCGNRWFAMATQPTEQLTLAPAAFLVATELVWHALAALLRIGPPR